jgi:twitching motility protein PilT
MSNSPDKSVPHLHALLARCVELDASDLHLTEDLPAQFRVEGILEADEHAGVLSGAVMDRMAVHLARSCHREPLGETGSLDGAVSSPDGTRFRFNIFRQQGRLSIALRRLEERFRSLAELGMPQHLDELSDLPDGLVLVAGPTGSGKSTTLATLIDRINRTRRCHIVTIEDPIEYLHRPLQSLVHQRQVGTDTESFHEALVASLRQDPDVILVGEIRDLGTIRTAITAAETGHLVFTTVHAGDCVGAIERIISVFPADEQQGMRRQLALVLRAIVAQHLIVADGPSERSVRAPEGEMVTKRRRVVTSEVLLSNSAVANLIATGKSTQIYSMMESGGAQGMQTLEEDLARLLDAGRISETTALALARNPNVLRERSHRLRQTRVSNGRERGRLR